MKKEYHIEYVFKNISASILWKLISTPNGLSEWFADNCKEEPTGSYLFYWNKIEDCAKILKIVENESIRFQWEDEDNFFEFQIYTNQLTQDVTLTIIDFAEESEMHDAKMLWDTQIETLRRSAGI